MAMAMAMGVSSACDPQVEGASSSPIAFRSDVASLCDGPQTNLPAADACDDYDDPNFETQCTCVDYDACMCHVDNECELGGVCGVCKTAMKGAVDGTVAAMRTAGLNCDEATGALFVTCNASLDFETEGLALFICAAATGAFREVCKTYGGDPDEIEKRDTVIAAKACKPVCWFEEQ